ncbi:MAG: phosphomannomutase/phosphoglucomutase, partial [Marinobacter sp.]
MKLGKKKNSEDAAPDARPDGKQAKKQSNEKKSATGPRHKRLTSVAVSQALVVVLAGVASAALLYFLLAVPAESRRYGTQASLEADAAAVRVDQQLALLQATVEGVADQDYVRAALRGEAPVSAAAANLAKVLPDIEAVYLFPYGDIPRTSSKPTLGFSGLDLARRAETGQRLFPDAFPRSGQWYLQMSTPVRNPQSRAVTGSVLVVFDAARLQPLMAGVNPALGGEFSLVQSVNGSTRNIVSRGSGNGPTYERDLVNPDWKLRYTPASAPAPLFSGTLAIVFALVPALVAAIVVWVMLGSAQRGLRQDITALIQWTHKVFGGERVKPPALKWDMVASTAEVLHRLAQMVEKRVAKAGESARPKPGSRQPSQSTADEPLFQDKDVLDIDMLDGDDDVLGFGGADGLDDTPDVEEVSLPEAEVSDTIFRAYDIRGIVDETLTA